MNTSLSLFDRIIAAFSEDRFSSYKIEGDSDLDTLTRYLWNAALCESLYPVLQNLEVGLRSRLNAALAHSFATPNWFFDDVIMSDHNARQKVGDAQRVLLTERKNPSASRLIAQLNFGFWTNLISARQHEAIWRRPGVLQDAFPYMPKSIRNRSTLAKRFTAARKLRNRIFHYEAIWQRDLNREHSDLVEALNWLDPCLQQVSQVLDRFAFVHTVSYQEQIRMKLIQACPVESKQLINPVQDL